MPIPSLDELFRRALDLNLRYYGAVGRLTAEYLRDVVAAVSELSGRQSPSAAPQAGAGQAVRSGPAMVLEAEAGGTALGVFLVENQLPHDVNAAVVASTFADASGRPLRVPFVFDPPRVSLKPGEQVLVRIQATLTEELQPDVRYAGEVTVPELRGTRIPIVLRRRPAAHPAT